MTQSARTKRVAITELGEKRMISELPVEWSVFETVMGWAAIAGNEKGVTRVLLAYESPIELHAAIRCEEIHPRERVWCRSWQQQIERYLSGRQKDLLEIPVIDTWSTPFQRAVIEALRAVPYGETLSYGELAARAGRPGASRAVGQVMAKNPTPLLVPCHRVLASGGRIGGFSAPTGLDLKRKLLALESR